MTKKKTPRIWCNRHAADLKVQNPQTDNLKASALYPRRARETSTMDNQDAVFTPDQLELLKKISPELFAALEADAPFARQAAQGILASRQRRAATEPENPPTPAVVQLPLWPDAVRAVPNGVLRSALFGATRKGRRRYINGEELAAIDGISIRYKGERLDQGDLDVWESVLHLAKHQKLGSEYRTTAYALLRMMGKTDSGKNRATLQARIERLVANAVILKQGRYTYIGSMISSAAKDEKTQEWVIRLDERLRPLFANDQFTQIEWSVRRALSGQPLAQWLHGFYSSHAAPYPLRIETLQQLCGSEMAETRNFAQTLKKALDAVSRACAAAGETFAWSIEGGLVSVTRTPTKTQRRHLAKRGK